MGTVPSVDCILGTAGCYDVYWTSRGLDYDP